MEKSGTMKGVISFLLFVFLIGEERAAAGPEGIGGRAAGMGSVVAVPDLWSVFSNQAGMAFTDGSCAGIFGEERFLLSELGSQALGVILSARPGAFGLAVHRFGGSLYSETQAGLSYARKFGTRFSAGLGLVYHLVSIAGGYGQAGMASFEIGLLYRADDRWTAGFHCQNPVPVYLSADRTCRLPAVMTLGLARDFEQKALLTAEIVQAMPGRTCLRAGFECRVGKVLALRAGIETDPWIVRAGVGILTGHLRIDAASSYHFILGYSPQLSLTYAFSREHPGRTHTRR
jgi:hypothetical protein